MGSTKTGESSLPLVLRLAGEINDVAREVVTGEYDPVHQVWDGLMPWQASGTTCDCPSDHDFHETAF